MKLDQSNVEVPWKNAVFSSKAFVIDIISPIKIGERINMQELLEERKHVS